MAQSCGSEPASALAALATCRSVAIDEDTCALDIRLHSEHPAQQQPTPTSMHFVLDNSGSMGSNTRNAQSCFARLVSSATEPSSLTVFSNEATHIGNFTTASSMQAASLPRQGQTNITAGIQTALMEVRKQEAINGGTTHHVLILLSDGAHNVGPHPSTGLPQLGEALRNDLPRLRLSVVVVGVTSSSDTSMGLLALKVQVRGILRGVCNASAAKQARERMLVPLRPQPNTSYKPLQLSQSLPESLEACC